MTTAQKYFKRSFDFFVSFLGLIVLGWLILLLVLIVSIITSSSGLFKQKRVGMNGKTFVVFKIKTMKDSDHEVTTITTNSNSRIFPFGRFLRKYKLDELPQLFNVLLGDMSLVGPRPDVPGYADKLLGDKRIVLTIRPGITGPASIYFRNEEEILAEVQDFKEYNDEVIWPKKVELNMNYIKTYTFRKDLYFIYSTLFK